MLVTMRVLQVDIVVPDGSTDATPVIAEGLAGELAEVRAVRMEQAGRGRALRAIWSASDAQVLADMDVDLSTDLNALLPLVDPDRGADARG
jgi:glycosyltransferase involved in cell wall biosynthesis